ncbi:LuxR family transcriptional regulator [Mycetocola tolaasinivorans]|uniref:LuxR family transcriptional regulator n=1 Tax=Mycetocola tolaasinivorans TaxID=76635 RepID=A0A3L7ACC4_9MICO|nr:helix-turn-helix transcriptional regulator [Mycetocola tolaasinivorans]RLP78003.1 LuxR family transcriptional regulator [Mycetocola tolaasinivorans]
MFTTPITHPPSKTPRLSPRERQVLALYALGETAEAVGTTLGIRPRTVYNAVGRIREKYAAVGREAAHRVHLYQCALEDGLLPSLRD